ncbi:MAG TPA: transaldolase family protein, partial [Nitrososphaerales archaeon]|nr:transaldolase family protein [Nitrososphaerales archaeon]
MEQVSADPSLRLTQLALAGYPQLAADSILRRENQGKVLSIIETAIGQLEQSFSKKEPSIGRKSIEVLLELALNFLGQERKRAGFSEEETSRVLSKISGTLQKWEKVEGSENVRNVVDQIIRSMKMVLSGKGMVAKMAEEIEAGLDGKALAVSFIESSRQAIQSNVYYKIVDSKLSKFGNDSATGLRWARHLGAVQVSSNPVIAARAYEEISDLWNRFGIVASAHPEWQREPERLADEIALYGTVVSLLPNILDFRPLALLSDFEDGMVSIQLNPLKAGDIEESVKDALKFCSILQEILQEYDAHLAPGLVSRNSSPNIVFKVSTAGIQSIGLTEALDKRGIGTNNTVTFTVSQEITTGLVAMRGLASALKSGIPITTIYITNMEGRLEDHLRETEASRWMHAALESTNDKESKLRSLAEKVGAVSEIKKAEGSLDQQVGILCSKKFLKSINDDWFVEVVGKDKAYVLKQLEEDIRMSGIYVTREAFQVLFKPELKPKLASYLAREFGLTNDQAASVVDAVNLLPASKRRAEDTYLVLADDGVSNLTNTEFPDHQLKVLQRSREKGFNLADFENSISSDPDPEVLRRLLEISDFRKAYGLTTQLVGDLGKIGVEAPKEASGLEPEEWSSYGPTRKTMEEFTNAYLSF